jgi:hypothetical protein
MTKLNVSGLVVVILISISLGFGTTIYYSSGETLRGMIWLKEYAMPLHTLFLYLASALPESLTTHTSRFYLPDFCWAYSIALLISSIWANDLKPSYLCIMAVIVASSFELAQLFNLMMGYFDYFDLLISIFAGILGCYSAIYLLRKDTK